MYFYTKIRSHTSSISIFLCNLRVMRIIQITSISEDVNSYRYVIDSMANQVVTKVLESEWLFSIHRFEVISRCMNKLKAFEIFP